MTQPHYIDPLPCPFCGGPAKTMWYNGTAQATCAGDYVECAGTDVLSPIAMWNRRAPAPTEAVAWRIVGVDDDITTTSPMLAQEARERGFTVQALAVIPETNNEG